MGLSRRELIGAGVAAIALGRVALARAAGERLDFAAGGDRDGWPGWTCVGAANLRCQGGLGVLEAATDVFPSDPRPVAFAVDRRFRDGEISAVFSATGAGSGVVVRRVAHRAYYAAVLDDEQDALILLRRQPGGAHELARAPVAARVGDVRLTLAARGDRLTATAQDDVQTVTVAATDDTIAGPGDPGVLATARTLFPSAGPAAFPALGNVHLLPYGVQEGEAFMQTAVGQEILTSIHERSTALVREIELRPDGAFGATAASVVAATSGAPARGGAILRVAADVPARVEIELSTDPRFRHEHRIPAGRTGAFEGAFARVHGLRPGTRVYWRARLRRRRQEAIGPTRSFRVLPAPGSHSPVRVAIGACASQFGPIFDHLTAARPDVFVWQGDLNYPDTVGPLAQTMSGYAGLWRELLINPRTEELFERALFAAQRDDHDYGVQDANSTILVPWGIAPWEALMEPRRYYRFAAGLAEFWVLDQRRSKSAPTLPDTPAKTLLGPDQRRWLLTTLARSRAPLKVICSPCTVAPLPANGHDGSWATHFTAERDLVLKHIARHVSGRTLFVTGDTHWTMAYEHDGLFEARPCPLGIPTPNDITLVSPNAAEDARGRPGVLYADDQRGHFALLDVYGEGTRAIADLALVRDDGAKPFQRRLESA